MPRAIPILGVGLGHVEEAGGAAGVTIRFQVEMARRRLELMEETTDGFRLAEADMDMRGPGQFFGTKQSGLPGLKVAKLTDVKLIELTRTEAGRMLDEDSGLTRPEHRSLNLTVRALLDRIVDEEH